MSTVSDDDRHIGAAIETPHDHDILSGRGNFVNYHSGNEHFRALVRKHKVAYVACPKSQKGKFSQMIVDEIKQLNPPGRFLKQDEATKLWYDIGEKKALDKTRQALREGAPEIQKVLSVDDPADPSTTSDVAPTSPSSGTQQISQHRNGTGSCENYDVAFSMGPTMSSQSGDHSNILSEENADPYCSTLPPQLYENFESKSAPSESINLMPIGIDTVHRPSAQDQQFAMQMTPQMQLYVLQNGGFLVPNTVFNRFGHMNVVLPPLMTINESQGQGFEKNSNLCSSDQQPFNGQQTISGNFQSNCGDLQEPIQFSPSGNTSSSYNQPINTMSNGAQSRILSENGLSRHNLTGNTMNRTYKVRPEPIMLRNPEKDNRTGSTEGRRLPPMSVPPEIVSSRPSQDSHSNPIDHRPSSPRRMISNRNGADFRSITPRRMGTDYFAISYSGSPPRLSRSRMRGRRDDSMRSMTSTRSIGFDKIFGEHVDDSIANKNSEYMSVMSLSVGDVLQSDYLDPNNLGPLFESSVKVTGNSQSLASSNFTGGSSMMRVPPKRLGSSDLMYIERGAYEMSVNTIPDASVDFGDSALMKMTYSQNDMSFFHVFDEGNRDHVD